MKALKSIILICVFLLNICCSFASAQNSATIYTDFSGTEFNENGAINKGTPIKIEITNDKKESFSGILIYSFYDEDKLEGTEIGEKISLGAEDEALSITYTTLKAYPNADTIKILLWKNMKTLVPLAEVTTAQKATGANGPTSQYKVFVEVPQDKITEQMPVPFNIDNYDMTEIASYNFDSFDFSTYDENGKNICGDFTQSYSKGLWSIVKAGGINDTPCVKLDLGEDATTARFQLVYRAENAAVGDWYCLNFKLKGENLTAKDSARPYIEFADSNKVTVGSVYGTGALYTQANNGWVECSVISSINVGANDIDNPSPYYDIYLNAFLEGESDAAVYIDDISLSKVVMDPMDTVLVTPNYKGFVYGDNGDKDINLRVNITDYNGGYAMDDFSLTCSLVDAQGNVYSSITTDTVTKTNDVTFSSSSLPKGEGDYYLVSVLKEAGIQVQKQEWTIRKRAESYRPKVYVDEDNRFIKDGVPMIPMFQYAHGGIYEEYLELAKSSALDAFTVAGEYHQGYRTPRMQRFRAEMEKHGVGAMLEACGYVYSHLYTGIPATNVKKQSDIRSLLTVYLNNFKDDPNLWVYRTFDEENAANYGEELRWQNDIMSSLDPDHPTMGVTDRTFATRPGVYAKTADIIGVDPYYCTGAEDQNLAGVGDMIAQFRELNPNRPVFATLQGFWYKNRGDLRGPTEQEYRNMVWQALCEGIVAIDTYSYTDMKANPWSGKTYEELWNEQATVLGEVEKFEQIILSTLPAPYYETDAEGVRLMSKRHNGKSYLFVVNTDNSAKTVKVKMEANLNATEYYTDAQLIADSEGYFTLNMGEYGVAILEIAQSDYLSPNAELIRFGVEGAPITNADSEIPDIIIDSSVTELSYKAETSDYAQVYINGVPVQNVGKINVEGASSLIVEVVSQDGKRETEKTFNIKRL
ncbi:MAG: hypothetical protein IKA17_01430 [Clostridia bacterium]|nr:hypothetical protein [Clostridia bacterium]